MATEDQRFRFSMDLWRTLMSRKAGVVVFVAVALSGCLTKTHYTGTFAELDSQNALTVTRTEARYGDDCWANEGSTLPTGYQIVRPTYTLRLVHGMRYWPELFAIALSPDGKELPISGDRVREVRATERRGGDMRRLREAREELALTHHLMLTRDRGRGSFEFDVRDAEGTLLGHEKLTFYVRPVSCLAIDGL